MHGAESSQNALVAEIETLRRQTKTLAAENANLHQRLNDQQHSLTFLDAIIHYLPTPIFVKDADALRFVRLNKAGEALLGCSQDEIIGKTDYDFFPVDEATAFTSKDRYVLSHGQLEDIAEESIHTRSQGVRLLHTKKIPLYDDVGQPQYLLAISEDITERKGAEKSLQTYAKRLQALTQLNRLVSSSLHMEDVLREMACATAKLMDVPLVILSIADETTQMLEVVAFSDQAMSTDCPIKTVRFGEGSYGWIATHQRILHVANVFEDDRFRGLDWWERHHLQSYYGIPIVNQGTLIGVLSMMGHQPFRLGSVEGTLLDSLMAQAITAVEHARHFQAMLIQAEATSRANQALGHEIAERKHAEARLQQAREELEDRVHDRTADLAQANDRLQAEIAERTQAEAALLQRETQLQQAHKMEAIGTLAGGIAHDFNNILAVVIGYTELLSLELTPETAPASYGQEILTACRRAKALVQQILTFSRQRDPERQPVPLYRVVNETLKLLRASLPATIAFECYIDSQSGAVMADPTQMHQVVMNLCTNAEHAMRPHGGLLEVRLEAIRVDAALASHHPPLRSGPHVRLMVRDTGHGILPDARARIFDPFFTTKSVGEGTGMGLAVVHGIIAHHDGVILVESQADEGTSFTIYLPQCMESTTEEGQTVCELPSGRGKILFVDDEAALTRAGQAMLSHLGYHVTAHTDSLEAFTCFQSTPEAFDLVITDQTMPYMTGEMLSQALRHIRPDIPIILCTGFSHVITKETALSLGLNAFLQKPLTLHELGATIQSVLAPHTTLPLS